VPLARKFTRVLGAGVVKKSAATVVGVATLFWVVIDWFCAIYLRLWIIHENGQHEVKIM
jgi:hypothetical protein